MVVGLGPWLAAVALSSAEVEVVSIAMQLVEVGGGAGKTDLH